jgi:hypothetical protein
MKHMTRTYKKEDAMLRPEHESTYEKQLAKRQNKKPATELNVANKYNQLQSLENKRMRRKQAIHDATNKIHDPDIA